MLRPVALAASVVASAAAYGVATAAAPVAAPLALLTPLPGLLLGTRGWRGECLLWWVGTTVALAAAVGPEVGLAFALLFGCPTVALAEAQAARWRIEAAVLVGLVTWCMAFAALALFAHGDVPGLVTVAREQVARAVDTFVRNPGIADGTSAQLDIDPQALVGAIIQVLPALLVLSGGAVMLVNLLLVRTWTPAVDQQDLRRWRTPDGLMWVLIASGFGMFVPHPGSALLATNVFLVLLGCYFCQGVAIIAYYLTQYRVPRGLRIATYALVVLQHVVAAVVLLLGVFDLWADFRRVTATPADMQFHPDHE